MFFFRNGYPYKVPINVVNVENRAFSFTILELYYHFYLSRIMQQLILNLMGC